MAEYIDKEDLLELYDPCEILHMGLDPETEKVPFMVVRQNIIDMIPADVKPVIRCKDCVGWKRAKGQSYGSCEHTAIVTNEDFWCAWGVKDDDGEDVEGWQ